MDEFYWIFDGYDVFARINEHSREQCLKSATNAIGFTKQADAVAEMFIERFGLKTNDESPTPCTIVDGGCVVTGSGGHETS